MDNVQSEEDASATNVRLHLRASNLPTSRSILNRQPGALARVSWRTPAQLQQRQFQQQQLLGVFRDSGSGSDDDVVSIVSQGTVGGTLDGDETEVHTRSLEAIILHPMTSVPNFAVDRNLPTRLATYIRVLISFSSSLV
jgi:hypothetical protein